MTRTATILREREKSALLATPAAPAGLWVPKILFREVKGSRRAAAQKGMTVEIDWIAPRHIAALWPSPDPNQQRLI